jgi:hypothetical protein
MRGLVGLSVLVAAAIVLSGAGSASAGGPLTGSITLVDKGWTCTSPVALASVSVTITKNFAGPLRGAGNSDAIHIHSGCTGTIGKLTVVQYQGDGIKVGQGAHDLVVQSGSVSCLDRAAGKHQDGVQVMGGRNILFRNLTVQCQTANNAAFFINQGTSSSEVPTDVVCDGCFLSGGGITVRIYHSVASGVENSTIVPGHLSPLHINKASAVNPINTNNTIAAAGSSPPPSQPVEPVVPDRGGTLTVVPVPKGLTLRPRFFGSVGVVSLRLQIGAAAKLTVSMAGPEGVTVPLLPKSVVGTIRSGTVRRSIVSDVTASSTIPVTIRVAARNLVRGRLYRVHFAATGPDGTTASVNQLVRRP